MSDSPHTPLAAARRAHVLEALTRDGVVRVSRLIDELGVSPVTLRRDLADMEKQGLLVRVHGGAVPPAGGIPAPSAPTARPRANGDDAIAVLVPSLDYYWPSVVRGVEEEARRRGYRVLVRGASYELQDERPMLERLVHTENVRGLIVAPNTDMPHADEVVRWLAECGVPSVLAERDAMFGGLPVESVASDHALGGRLAARHLASLGHERIGLVMTRTSPTSRKITTGWHLECEELGLGAGHHFESLIPDRSSPEFSAAVDAALDTTLELGLTALLVHSDREAMAFIDLALNRGLSVPGELSIMAYDDEVAQLFSPPVTAVGPPKEAVGAAAVALLLARIADPARPVHRLVLNPELRVRESTAAPRERH